MACPQVLCGGDTLHIWSVAANVLLIEYSTVFSKESRTADEKSSSYLGLELIIFIIKISMTECHTGPQIWADILERP